MIIGYDVFLCELRYPSRLVYNVVNPFDIYTGRQQHGIVASPFSEKNLKELSKELIEMNRSTTRDA